MAALAGAATASNSNHLGGTSVGRGSPIFRVGRQSIFGIATKKALCTHIFLDCFWTSNHTPSLMFIDSSINVCSLLCSHRTTNTQRATMRLTISSLHAPLSHWMCVCECACVCVHACMFVREWMGVEDHLVGERGGGQCLWMGVCLCVVCW